MSRNLWLRTSVAAAVLVTGSLASTGSASALFITAPFRNGANVQGIATLAGSEFHDLDYRTCDIPPFVCRYSDGPNTTNPDVFRSYRNTTWRHQASDGQEKYANL